MISEKQDNIPLTETKLYQFVRKSFSVTKRLHNEHFFIHRNGRHFITPLFFALLVIETMDIIFAIDSIPAIFLITQDVFIVYTSNIFAILGLRSLYFLLAAAVNRFVYLKLALAIILIFIGSKIFLPYVGLNIDATLSLSITFGILFIGIFASLIKTKAPAAK